MTYSALPDHRIPYDNDGTVVAAATGTGSYLTGIGTYPTNTVLQELQDEDGYTVSTGASYLTTDQNSSRKQITVWMFFPEQRAITAGFFGCNVTGGALNTSAVEGSNDSVNGVDGTWETASVPSGAPMMETTQYEHWRVAIRPISFTGGKRVIRIRKNDSGGIGGGQGCDLRFIHLYGEKSAGQTPDDIVYIDHDTTPGVEFATPEDFGDRPLGTSVVREFRIKNVSPSKTANTITINCNDAEFAISSDGSTWATSVNITSLGPGVESATLYVRNTTPAPGALLGPRFARIVTTVGSWT